MSAMVKFFWVVTIMALCTSSAKAQHYPMLHFGVEDGLPTNKIYHIYRDSRGFLWVATDKGVARYNGIKFEKFTTDDGLADNEVFFFQEDCYGRIWMATYNGQLCYFQDEQFHTAANTPFLKLPIEFSNFSKGMIVEKDSTLTIWNNGDPNILNVYKDKIVVHNIKNKSNDEYLLNMSLDGGSTKFSKYRFINARKYNDSVYEIVYRRNIMHVDRNGKIFKRTLIDNNTLFSYAFAQNKNWFYDDSFIYDGNFKKLRMRPDADKRSSDLSRYKVLRLYQGSNALYSITDSGLYENDRLILKKNAISHINQDGAGNFYIGTLNDGLLYLDRNYASNRFDAKMYNGSVRYCCVRNGRLLYITEDNSVFNYNNGNPVCLYSDKKVFDRTNYVRPISPGYLVDSADRLYYFYYDKHVVLNNIFNPQSARKTYITSKTDGIKGVFLKGGNTYIYDGMDIVKNDYSILKNGDILDHKFKYCRDSSISDRIFCLAQAGDGSIWYSTVNKIYKIIEDKSVPQNQFSKIFFKTFDFVGNYLIGYSNNILYICNNYDGKMTFDTIRERNCIWDKFYRIDSNSLLVSTNNNYRLITVRFSAGKPQYDITRIENPIVPLQAEAICSDGNKCYFFKKESITTIDVTTLKAKPTPPALYFSTIKIGDRVIAAKDGYKVPFEKAANLVLSFSVVAFSAKDNQYQYSVSKNETDNWNNISGQDITIVNPAYGNNIIKVRAKTISGDFSPAIKYNLYIIRPFWATWWFIVLNVIVLGLIIAFFVSRRISAIISKREQAHSDKVRYLKSEYKALNALMNPHFIFNTLNNVQSLFNGNNKLAANEYLRVFADLVRQNMHNVSKELIPLQKEVDLVSNYLMLEKLRFEDKLNYIVNIDEDLELYNIMVPPLLIQPLVENSIKHGILPMIQAGGSIQVNISGRDDILKIEIKDNGVGLNNSKQKEGSLHESFGLDNIRKRIEQLSLIQGKEITFQMSELIDEQDTRWTTVTITMPL